MIDPPADLATLTAPAPTGIAFRAVPWRLYHAGISLVPLIAYQLANQTSWYRSLSLHAALAIFLFSLVWMATYPLYVARWHGWRLQRTDVNSRTVVLDLFVAVFTVGGAWVVLAIGYFIWTALFGELNRSPSQFTSAASSNDLFLFVALTAIAVLVGPVAEEVLYRGVMYRALRRYVSRVLAVVLQAAVFGLTHWQHGMVNAVVVGLGGIALAVVCTCRKTLLTPILCHAVHNTAVAGVALWIALATGNEPVMGLEVSPAENGVLVTKVIPGGGSEAAGIQTGDMLDYVDEHEVRDAKDIREAIRDKKPGETVIVKGTRDDRKYWTVVTLRTRRAASPR